MTITRHQELLVELHQRRSAANATTLAEVVEPIQTVSGVVDGGPALLVENASAESHSAAIEARVSAGNATARNFAVSADADEVSGVGVIGRGSYGVIGQSEDNVGVMGFGTTGLFGLSNDPHGNGVEGHTTSPSGIGVLASAPSADVTALGINNGNIRVLDAGENTPTPVFIHVTSEHNTRAHQTVIDHPMTNGDPRAVLLVTRRETVSSNTQPQPDAFAVAWNTTANKWLIVQAEDKPLPLGARFNVLVFKI